MESRFLDNDEISATIPFIIRNAGFALKIKHGRVNFAYRNVNFTHYGELLFNLLRNIHCYGFQQWLRNIHPVFHQLVQHSVVNSIRQPCDHFCSFIKVYIEVYFKVVARRPFFFIQAVKGVES